MKNRLGFFEFCGSQAFTWIMGTCLCYSETLDQAALRELREEAGLDGEPCGMVSARTRVTEEGGAVFVSFRIRCDGSEPVPDSYEVDAAQFFSREELSALNPVMEISRQIALVVLAAPGTKLVETDIPGRNDLMYKAYTVKSLGVE